MTLILERQALRLGQRRLVRGDPRRRAVGALDLHLDRPLAWPSGCGGSSARSGSASPSTACSPTAASRLPKLARVPRHGLRHAGERGRRDHVGRDAPHPPRQLRRARQGPAHAQGRLLVEPHRLDPLQDRHRLPRDGAPLRAGAGGRPRAPRAEPPPRASRTSCSGFALYAWGGWSLSWSGACSCGSW